jgi:phosphoglycerate dehydrogenase-like enzyme
MEKICVLVNKEFRGRVFSQKYYDKMAKFGEVKVYDKDDFSDKEYYLNFVKGSTVIVTSWDSPKIDKVILDVCPNLKGVLHGAGSIKPIISEEFVERKIRITNSAVAIGEGVAETALGFAISACKGFYQLNRDTGAGLWQENVKTTVKDFYDIQVGVISAGYVGRHMIKLLKNFHVDILVYDPTVPKEKIQELGAEKVELNELLSRSDVITIHAPGLPETTDMINKDNISLIKDDTVIINTSRGFIINEQALIDELKKGKFFACIDVTTPEPPTKDNPLRTLNNVVLTPHIAGTATNGLRRVALHVCEELERLVNGEKMRVEVNLDDLSKIN